MKKRTVGVLTPLTDGFYFNGMLAGIHAAARRHETNLLCIQTYNSRHVNQYDHCLGLDQADGWIVLLNAVTQPGQIARFQAAGKPVVCTPNPSGFTGCTTFMIDNEQGGYEATRHLIGHGHRRIAFVRCPDNEESMERYRGYKRALQECGLQFEPRLIFDVVNLWDKYGKAAAQLMQQRGFDFTAAVVSSDLTAIGILQAFQSLGIRVPEDIALFSFDNTDYARRFSLSSVAQPLVDRGVRMMELLLAQIVEPSLAAAGTPIVTEPMQPVYRRSCGCDAIPPSEDLETLYGDSLETIEYLSGAIQRNHEIGRNLVQTGKDAVRNLSWLSYTAYTWGCLALWRGEGRLQIDSIFSTKSEPYFHTGEQFAEADFPPPGLHRLVGEDETLSVHTVKINERDFGFLLLIGDMFDKNRTSRLGPLIHSVAHTLDLLAYALEREALYEEARQREERLEIVSSTTNDGIFDWDLATGSIRWNRQISHILDNVELTMTADELLGRVHPDDRAGLQAALSEHYVRSTPFQQEFRMQKKHDDWIWISAAGKAIRDQRNVPLRMIGSIVDISERKHAEAAIRFIAYHDALTGLPNRRYVYDRLAAEMAREDSSFAVLMLDLDGFKAVNDKLGHLAGDELLRRVSALLLDAAGPDDYVARLGGDEFLVLCGAHGRSAYAEALAQKILEQLQTPFNIDNQPIRITPSIGISRYPEHGADIQTLIRHADRAMYQVKENGKNQIRLYAADNEKG